jgi:hypothetical protein
MAHVTIQQSLQHVADNPTLPTDDLISVPAHLLISHTLFEIANGAQLDDNKSLARANTARTMIFQRLVGKRRAGSHPATRKQQSLTFKDLAGEESGE